MTKIQGILLAAGKGQRFGGHKLLHPLPSGESMGVAAARNLVAALPCTLAVIRPQDQQLAQQFKALGLGVVVNSEAELGMGHSLSIGIRASADAPGWVVALADMPWIAPETILSVAWALVRGASMAAPAYQGRRGHPVGFGQRWGDRLQALRGDFGARHLLEANADNLILLPTDDRGILLDIDRHADLNTTG